MTDIKKIPLFLTDLKKLRKNYRSIDEDLDLFLKALLSILPGTLPNTFRIPLHEELSDDPVYKVKSFRCRSLKGSGSRSGIRVIYGYHSEKDIVTLIQIYHKSQNANHDESRISNFLRTDK